MKPKSRYSRIVRAWDELDRWVDVVIKHEASKAFWRGIHSEVKEKTGYCSEAIFLYMHGYFDVE